MDGLVVANLVGLWVVVLGNLLLTAVLIRRVRGEGPLVARDANLEPAHIGPDAGEPAPDFEARLADGTAVRLSDYRGRPLVVVMLSVACAPCARIGERIRELAGRLEAPRGSLLAVVTGSAEEAETALPGLLESRVTVLLAGAEGAAIARTYGLPFPSYCLVDADGRVVRCGLARDRDQDWRLVEGALA